MNDEKSYIEVVIYDGGSELARRSFCVVDDSCDDITQFFDETNTFDVGNTYEIDVNDVNGGASHENAITVTPDEYTVSDIQEVVQEAFEELQKNHATKNSESGKDERQ